MVQTRVAARSWRRGLFESDDVIEIWSAHVVSIKMARGSNKAQHKAGKERGGVRLAPQQSSWIDCKALSDSESFRGVFFLLFFFCFLLAYCPRRQHRPACQHSNAWSFTRKDRPTVCLAEVQPFTDAVDPGTKVVVISVGR